MSTFGGLNTSHTALNAARTAVDVAGQNIANVKTPGYTRQRAELASSPVAGPIGVLALSRPGPGQGVMVTGIARLANEMLNEGVREASASSGYHATRAAALETLETGLREPGKDGLSARMQEFWASWQDLGNAAGDGAAAAVVLQQAATLAARIADGSRAVSSQWSALRKDASTMVDQVNHAAARVAELNDTIRRSTLAGGQVNELLDERDRVAADLASIAGGQVYDRGDGTVDVLVAGNPIVTGTTANRLVLAGPTTPGGTGAVSVQWERRPGTAIDLDGGELAGALSMLAPASGGTGGPLNEALASYDAVATALAEQVNAVHRTGATPNGTTGLDFFAFDPGVPAALGLRVIPTDVSGIAAALPGAGAKDGTIADRIAGIGRAAGSPDEVWGSFVGKVGIASGAESSRAQVAALGLVDAVGRQQSESAVDLDEENLALVTAQTAYQGAARVFTAIDEMLEVLITRTGVVGR